MILDDKSRSLHFIGIGGAGMSGLSLVAHRMGFNVDGCDLHDSSYLSHLREAGIPIFMGHNLSHVIDRDIIIYSSAINKENPELLEAKKLDKIIMRRGEFLSSLFNINAGIGIAGTHGKTTTTSLISVVMEKSGVSPTSIIGGELSDFGGNARLGNGDYFIAEIDESDGSIVSYNPYIAIATNIDIDHVDYYKDIKDLKKVFLQFMSNVKSGGAIVYCAEDENLKDVVASVAEIKNDILFLSYGWSKDMDYCADDISINERSIAYNLWVKGKAYGRVKLNIPGSHNVLNSLAVFAAAGYAGLSINVIKEYISEFSGVKRRFEVVYKSKEYLIIDDYGHHPTEIKTVIDAARKGWPNRRIIIAFQPHRYSRTEYMYKDFAMVLSLADVVFLAPLYSAGEAPISGVTEKIIVETMKKNDEFFPVISAESFSEITNKVEKTLRPGDIFITIGAGNIGEIGYCLRKRLSV